MRRKWIDLAMLLALVLLTVFSTVMLLAVGDNASTTKHRDRQSGPAGGGTAIIPVSVSELHQAEARGAWQ